MEKLRNKYKAAESEIADLTQEHQQQKNELLDIIRTQEKAVKFSNRVMGIMLSENELYKLHQRSKWDDERGDWNIPLFTFNPKAKDISFPTINAKQRVDQAKEEREIKIQDPEYENDDRNNESEFRKAGNFNHNRSKKKQVVGKTFSQTRPQEKNGVQTYNHSADETTSQEHHRAGDQSWMEDRFSQDNMSHNNLRDSHSNGNGIQIRK
jgi:hypothetical protein